MGTIAARNTEKSDERVRHEGVFVGYKQLSGSMQYLILVRGKLHASCNVTFSEARLATPRGCFGQLVL